MCRARRNEGRVTSKQHSEPDDIACANTDRELWREGDGDGNGMSYYEPSIHVTEQGGIGINVGGMVYVKTLREWHGLEEQLEAEPFKSVSEWRARAEQAEATLAFQHQATAELEEQLETAYGQLTAGRASEAELRQEWLDLKEQFAALERLQEGYYVDAQQARARVELRRALEAEVTVRLLPPPVTERSQTSNPASESKDGGQMVPDVMLDQASPLGPTYRELAAALHGASNQEREP
jgi:hypothetical protein